MVGFLKNSKDAEKWRNIASFELSYKDFKSLCGVSWKHGDCNYLCIDRSEKKFEGKHCVCNENENFFWSVYQKQKFLKSELKMIYSVKLRDVLWDLEELEESKSDLKQVFDREHLVELGFH